MLEISFEEVRCLVEKVTEIKTIACVKNLFTSSFVNKKSFKLSSVNKYYFLVSVPLFLQYHSWLLLGIINFDFAATSLPTEPFYLSSWELE